MQARRGGQFSAPSRSQQYSSRHSAASEIRSRYGLEASQAVLGHSELATTQIYAEVDRTTARRIMSEVG